MIIFMACIFSIAAIFMALPPLVTGEPPKEIQLQFLRQKRQAALFIIIFIPFFSVGFYYFTGSPSLPDMPLAQRQQQNQADVSAFLKNLEAHLQSRPDDLRGWLLLARSARGDNNIEKAISAFRKVIDLDKEEVVYRLGLAEALIAAKDKAKNLEANALLQDILRKDPEQLDAIFLLARSSAQNGYINAASAGLKKLLIKLPGNSPLRPIVESELQNLETLVKAAPAARP